MKIITKYFFIHFSAIIGNNIFIFNKIFKIDRFLYAKKIWYLRKLLYAKIILKSQDIIDEERMTYIADFYISNINKK